ncbi:MAG: single-stranded DNA-binding protein [Candidatus Kapaibacteriales bacterium]
MAFTLNKVILIGNLGADPEYRVTPQGLPICRFRIATSENYKDKSGVWQKNTEWHNIVVFGPPAEVSSRFLKKGSKVFIEGRNKTRSYEVDGRRHYITEVIARSVVFLDSRADSESASLPAIEDDFTDPTSFYINDIHDSSVGQNSADYLPEDDDLPF